MYRFGDSDASCKCSFCGSTGRECGRLVAGPGVFICSECVQLCSEILEGEKGKDIADSLKLPKPKDIMEFLNQYVIGQERAKKILSVAVYNHYKRINANMEGKHDVELQKSNVLLIGPTGSGKTYLAQTLAKKLNVPIAIADATSLTEAGYVGEDVENILLKLIQAADYDIEKASRGIIYIDEIDKITRKSENPSITRDVSGEGVQQALLKIIEGTVASVPPQGGRKHPHQELIQIDTNDILFICGGAFEGLTDIIEQRVAKQSLGFRAVIESKEDKKDYDDDLLKQVIPEDIIKYGIIPEFTGRLPILVTLNALDEEALVKILTEPKNALVRQYQKLFEIDGVDLEVTPEAVSYIAKEAYSHKTGARALRTVIEDALLDVMYAIPSAGNVSKCTVNDKVFSHEEEPALVYSDDDDLPFGEDSESIKAEDEPPKKRKRRS